MAKKTTRPIDVLNADSVEFKWETFIPNIINGKYVLVLGSEIMLSKELNVECAGDSTRLIFNCVKDNLISQSNLGPDNHALNFTELSQVTPDVTKCIRKMVNKGLDFEVSEMAPELVALLQTGLFRTVLTTTIDPYIERLMHDVFKDDLKVMDISAETSSEEFDIQEYSRNDIPEQISPRLYYVFGKASSSSRFVATDNDAIEIMAKWMGANAPNNFLSYVRDKRILALGCKFDDWFFRFFWYILKGNIQKLSHGEVAVSLNDTSETDVRLKSYLNQSEIYFRPDARSFISEMLEKINDYQASETETILSGRRHRGIFLSYAHEDFDLVKTIYYRLVECGLPVWFDERNLIGGDDYDARISSAISDCKVFLPILSRQVQKDIMEANSRFYKDTEWTIAQTYANGGKDITIIPLRIWGYDVRDENNISALPECLRCRTVHDLERQTLDELIFQLKDILRN